MTARLIDVDYDVMRSGFARLPVTLSPTVAPAGCGLSALDEHQVGVLLRLSPNDPVGLRQPFGWVAREWCVPGWQMALWLRHGGPSFRTG